ncbi:hypothetical protein BDZ94DRAFT_1243393 [Collybia nuda]|uniref:F-box domain-containing protein n=1 Tax=Collybia nuda TaxID=64659 RepID=A0A9P5YJM9_9AGAR|nr:hypothetical protein BDZ94DRAFT_1243393 [Collybia nuda]
MSFTSSSIILDMPPEVTLYILSFLDLPELAFLVQAFPALAILAADPILHKNRVKVIAPSRVEHSLFGASPHGLALRPTVGDLVHRGVIRGLAIERRWRMGMYFYSRSSITQYENSLQLARQHVSDVISIHLKRRSLLPNAVLSSLHLAHVLPDVESSSLNVSRTLLPILHKLKWCLQRDKLSNLVKINFCGSLGTEKLVGFGAWLEKRGKGVVKDGERVRLAVCPNIRKTIEFYEERARQLD